MAFLNSAWKALFLGSIVALAPLAHAQDDGEVTSSSVETTAGIPSASEPYLQNNFLGGQAGAGILSSSGGTHLNFGLSIGRKILPDTLPQFIVGAFFDHISRGSVSSADDPTAVNIDSNLNFYGLEGSYQFTQWVPGGQIGLKLALGNNSVTTNGVDNSSTDFYLGPKVAWDVGVGNGLTAGLEGNVLFATGGESRTTTSILGTLKYWLG